MISFNRVMRSGGYECMSSEEIVRHVRELDMYSGTSLTSPPAHADPIFTPLFASIGLGSVSIAGVSGATIASALATTALSIGLQYLLAPKPPKPDDGKAPVTQSIPYRQWVVGRRRVSGAYMLWEAKGAKLYAVQAIAGHRISAVNRYWLHDDEVTLDGVGNVNGLADKRYTDNLVQVYSRVGIDTEYPYAEIVADIAADGVWTDNHRGDGQASVALVAKTPKAKDFSTRFPYGAPRLSVEIDGALVWDYRIDANPLNPAAWVFSRNAALIMCWHQCFSEFGHRRDYSRAILPVLDMWIEEADICDEDVPLAGGGTEKRYLCDGFATAEHDPKIGTNAILAACDGWICERGDGALLFVVGKFREKYVSVLRDADITGYQVQHDVLFKDECNRLIPKFTYPATDYTTTDTDYYEDPAGQIVAGRVLAQEADYGWCTQWRQARRLGKRDWLRFQQRKKGTLDVRLSGINAIYNRWVRMETPLGLPSLNGAVLENRRSVLALTKGGFTLDFVGHPDDIDAWTPATDESQAPPVPPKPSIADIPTPEIHGVAALASAGSVYLRIEINDPGQDDLSLQVRYRIKDTGGGSPGLWVDQVFTDPGKEGGFVVVGTNPVPGDQLLEVEALFLSAKGQPGLWSAAAEVFSASDPVAPAGLATFAVTDSAPHLGRAILAIVIGNDAHARTVRLYRVATGTAFDPGAATAIASLSVSPSSSYAYTDGDASRTNLIVNGDFASDTVWSKQTGWTISGGAANHSAGVASDMTQAASLSAGTVYRCGMTVSALTGGKFMAVRFLGGTIVQPTGTSLNGPYLTKLTAVSGNNQFGVRGNQLGTGSVDNVALYAETASCAPQGIWDYYAVPFNSSGISGPVSGPLTVAVI